MIVFKCSIQFYLRFPVIRYVYNIAFMSESIVTNIITFYTINTSLSSTGSCNSAT